MNTFAVRSALAAAAALAIFAAPGVAAAAPNLHGDPNTPGADTVQIVLEFRPAAHGPLGVLRQRQTVEHLAGKLRKDRLAGRPGVQRNIDPRRQPIVQRPTPRHHRGQLSMTGAGIELRQPDRLTGLGR